VAEPILRYFERDIVTPGPGLTELNPPLEVEGGGKFLGFDPGTGDALTKDLNPFDILGPSTSTNPPVAGTLSGSFTIATNVDLVVAYVEPGDRPPVLTWHWFRDGVERGTTIEPDRTFSDSTVPNDSNAHSFFVRGESVDGLGDPSNSLSLTFGGTSVVAPTAPTGFNRSNLTSTQVDLNWSETPDARVDKHGIFEQGQTPGINAPAVDNIDPTALTFTRTNQTPGSQHSGVGVARHIPDAGAPNNGWSPKSNVITYTHPVVLVQHDVVMGSTTNDEWTAAKSDFYPNMAACRTYNISGVIADLNLTNARVMCVTPNGSGENVGNVRQTNGVVSALEAALEEFYYNTNGTPRTGNRSPTTGTEYHFALDNETDRGASPNTIYINNHRDCRDVIHQTDGVGGGGTRRYPRASLWVDMTQNNIRTGGSATAFKPIARYLDGFGCSMYPPGRQAHTAPGTVNDNVTFSSYASYIDDVITAVQDWMLTGGATGGPSPITMFGTWEFGIPIDHPFRDSNSDGNSGEPTDLTNFTVRPRYCTGGIDSTNHDWKGFLQYLLDALDSIGCIMREQLYWNQQSNPDIPNQFWHDQTNRPWDARPYPAPYNNQTGFGSTRATIDLESAWFNWTPGSRLPHG
jgi:hypothetical protein